MSYFKSSIGKKIYYEVSGRGEPLIMLNGIMMSTASWQPFVPVLSKKMKVILVDLLDMGKSDSMGDMPQYMQSLQADILSELVTHLGYEKVSVMGISYGGEVALQFALNHPSQIDKLMLFNTSSHTSKWLYDISEGWNATGARRDGETYYNITIPYFYSAKFYESHLDWMDRRRKVLHATFSDDNFQERMGRLVLSTLHYDVRQRLQEIVCPTLILGSDADTIIPIHEQRYLHNNIKGSTMVVLPDCGHCSMMESPYAFATLIIGFVNLHGNITI